MVTAVKSLAGQPMVACLCAPCTSVPVFVCSLYLCACVCVLLVPVSVPQTWLQPVPPK